jgi:hypothetical protein
MDDALGRMDDLLEIERLGGDLHQNQIKGQNVYNRFYTIK